MLDHLHQFGAGHWKHATVAIGLVVLTVIAATIAAGGRGVIAPAVAQPPVAALRLLPSLATTGSAALVKDDRLLILSDGSGDFHSVTTASADGYLQNPAWRPDGKAVAYARFGVALLPPASQPPSDSRFTSDIWQTDLEGNQRLLVSGEGTGRYSQPAWSSDGGTLYVVSETSFQRGGIKGIRQEIDRVDLASGQKSVVVDDGFAPSVSPDGTLLAYVNLADTGRADLWLLDLRNGQRRRLTDGRFSSVTSPRFSANAQTIAFSAGEKRGRVQPQTAQPGLLLDRFSSLVISTANAHELLDGLWLVAVDGTQMRPVGNFRFDNPTVSWATDSNFIFLFDEDALYQIDVVGRLRHTIFQPGGYRGFDWIPSA